MLNTKTSLWTVRNFWNQNWLWTLWHERHSHLANSANRTLFFSDLYALISWWGNLSSLRDGGWCRWRHRFCCDAGQKRNRYINRIKNLKKIHYFGLSNDESFNRRSCQTRECHWTLCWTRKVSYRKNWNWEVLIKLSGEKFFILQFTYYHILLSCKWEHVKLISKFAFKIKVSLKLDSNPWPIYLPLERVGNIPTKVVHRNLINLWGSNKFLLMPISNPQTPYPTLQT